MFECSDALKVGWGSKLQWLDGWVSGVSSVAFASEHVCMCECNSAFCSACYFHSIPTVAFAGDKAGPNGDGKCD